MEEQAIIKKAQQLAQRRANAAAKRAAAEGSNKKKGLEYERKMHAMTAPKKEADLVHPLRKSASVPDVTMAAAATLGESVVVESDLARVGPPRHGGAGRVVEVAGAGGATRVAVKYTIGGRIERDIGVERITHGYPVYQKRPTRAKQRAAPVQLQPPSLRERSCRRLQFRCVCV